MDKITWILGILEEFHLNIHKVSCHTFSEFESRTRAEGIFLFPMTVCFAPRVLLHMTPTRLFRTTELEASQEQLNSLGNM